MGWRDVISKGDTHRGCLNPNFTANLQHLQKDPTVDNLNVIHVFLYYCICFIILFIHYLLWGGGGGGGGGGGAVGRWCFKVAVKVTR